MENFDWEKFQQYYLSGIMHCRCGVDLRFNKEIGRDLQYKSHCISEDWEQYSYLVRLIPEERDQDMQGLLIHGFKLKEAFELLKETYNF